MLVLNLTNSQFRWRTWGCVHDECVVLKRDTLVVVTFFSSLIHFLLILVSRLLIGSCACVLYSYVISIVAFNPSQVRQRTVFRIQCPLNIR